MEVWRILKGEMNGVAGNIFIKGGVVAVLNVLLVRSPTKLKRPINAFFLTALIPIVFFIL